ncbi:MAG: acetylglutamate kinase [Eubacteriaceae bacterium]|nr:acetylglutamate kinase [Eubacteriaceae bacterium]
MTAQLSNQERAEVLIDALPYIQKYHNKIVVVKYGGNAMDSIQAKRDVMSDLVLLSLVGIKIVLVHGGGPEITQMLEKVGKKSEFLDGLRVTDKETTEIATMVLAGKVNKDLVSTIQTIGGRAVGISGMDGGLISAKFMDERLGYVGDITEINPAPVLDLLSMGYIPVISTIGFDMDSNTYNINADTAASEIAAALEAESFICMTDVVGVLKDPSDPSSLIPHLTLEDAQKCFDDGIISGGMIPKAQCCINAVKKGVNRVFIIDGRTPHSVLIELLSNKGIGTMFTMQEV